MTTLEALTPTVQAMHGEVQQLMQERTLINQAVQRVQVALNQLQAQQVQDVQAAAATTQSIRDSGDLLTKELYAMAQRLAYLEQQGANPSVSAQVSKKKRGTRPKDMEPEKCFGKDEDWMQWKEATEDYADAVHPGLKHVVGVAAKVGGPISDRSQLPGVLVEEWN